MISDLGDDFGGPLTATKPQLSLQGMVADSEQPLAHQVGFVVDQEELAPSFSDESVMTGFCLGSVFNAVFLSRFTVYQGDSPEISRSKLKAGREITG